MRWLYGVMIVLAALIGIAAFYPDSAPLVRRQIQLLTGYSQRKTLLPDPSRRGLVLRGAVLLVISHTPPAPEQQDFDDFRKRLRQLAAQHPDDAQIQFVHKMLETREGFVWIVLDKGSAFIIWNWILWPHEIWPVYDSSPLKELHALRQRFPNDLGLHALLLHRKMSELVLRRDRTEKIFHKKHLSPNRAPTAPKRWSNPDAAARMLTLAREGERLEPQNGFFTLMRAVALLEMKRDEEAVQALIEASRKPIWNSYESWLTEAYYKAVYLSQAWHRSVKPEMGYTFLQFSPWTFWEPPPQYVRMTRLFVGLAAAHEKRGEWHKGVAIRVALARLIARMRYQQLYQSHNQSSQKPTQSMTPSCRFPLPAGGTEPCAVPLAKRGEPYGGG
jgi:hypothetical protein